MRFSEFHDNWQKLSLKKCSTNLNYGLSAPAIEYDNVHKYIRITDIDENTNQFNQSNLTSPQFYDDEHIVKENDILFARTGASVGKTYHYNKGDGLLYYAGFLIAAHIKENYNSSFIFYYTQTPKYKKWVKIMSTRSGQPGINAEEYGSFPIWIPSKFEQDKIVCLLEKIDKEIQTQIKIIDVYSSFIKAIGNTLIGCKKENIEIGRCLDCYSSNIREKDLELITSGNYPVYGANGCIKKISKYDISGSSIAIIKDGANVGKITKLNGKYSILSTMNYLTAKQGYDLNYLYYSLKQKSLNKYVVGSGIPHIYFKDYKQEKIYIPHDRFLIANITSLLTNIDEMIQIETKKLDKYKSQKQYLLKNMFI